MFKNVKTLFITIFTILILFPIPHCFSQTPVPAASVQGSPAVVPPTQKQDTTESDEPEPFNPPYNVEHMKEYCLKTVSSTRDDPETAEFITAEADCLEVETNAMDYLSTNWESFDSAITHLCTEMSMEGTFSSYSGFEKCIKDTTPQFKRLVAQATTVPAPAENQDPNRFNGSANVGADICEEVIKKRLISSHTAEFHSLDELSGTKYEGDTITVSSYVTAQNLAGAEIKSDFVCTLKLTDAGDGKKTVNLFSLTFSNPTILK